VQKRIEHHKVDPERFSSMFGSILGKNWMTCQIFSQIPNIFHKERARRIWCLVSKYCAVGSRHFPAAESKETTERRF
jgi:hypothetical protein